MYVYSVLSWKAKCSFPVIAHLLLPVPNLPAGASAARLEGERPVGNKSIEELRPYNAYYAEDTDAKKIYLTFDCGYENGNTPLILDALKNTCKTSCIFSSEILFQIIRNLSTNRFGGTYRRNHTMTHPDMSGISSLDAFQKQLDDVEELYESVTGEK